MASCSDSITLIGSPARSTTVTGSTGLMRWMKLIYVCCILPPRRLVSAHGPLPLFLFPPFGVEKSMVTSVSSSNCASWGSPTTYSAVSSAEASETNYFDLLSSEHTSSRNLPAPELCTILYHRTRFVCQTSCLLITIFMLPADLDRSVCFFFTIFLFPCFCFISGPRHLLLLLLTSCFL